MTLHLVTPPPPEPDPPRPLLYWWLYAHPVVFGVADGLGGVQGLGTADGEEETMSEIEVGRTYDPKMPGHRRGVWRRTVLAITPAADWLGECSTKGGAVVSYELAGAPPPRLRYCSASVFRAWARL